MQVITSSHGISRSKNINFFKINLRFHTIFVNLYEYMVTRKCKYKGDSLAKKKTASAISLKEQSHEKVGEMSVWGISLGPN
jgi:hypothetical protein